MHSSSKLQDLHTSEVHRSPLLHSRIDLLGRNVGSLRKTQSLWAVILCQLAYRQCLYISFIAIVYKSNADPNG